MLTQVLHALEKSNGQVDLDQLSTQLDIDRYVLGGMIEFWIRKGKVRPIEFGTDCYSPACGSRCPGAADCPLFATLPPAYRIADGQ